MGETNYRGIDYGRGITNIDRDSGIHYGVISQHAILQAWADSSEPDYGDPTCPQCGGELVEWESLTERQQSRLEPYMSHSCSDYACKNCKHHIGSDEAFGDEPIRFTLEDEEYSAFQSGGDSDIFVVRSPFYTHAQFCSPCAPGACHMENPCESGERTYCFGLDFFDETVAPCPYPIYRVDTGELVYSPRSSANPE